MNELEINPKALRKIITGVVIAIIVLVSVFKSSVTISAGKMGVLYKVFSGGVVTDQPALSEGFHVIAPWNKVTIFEIRQQELFENMKVLSSNGLEIKLEVSVWYQPDSNNLGRLLQEKGPNYIDAIIRPAIRSAARSVVGRYTPEQLYSTKRDIVQKEIYEETKKIVQPQYLKINEILVRDVQLPSSIKDAIERKLKQEQESLEYEFRLEKARKEADRQRIEAEGKAKANKILSASLTDKILQEKGVGATLKLSESQNAKVIVIGSGKNGLPVILGNQ